MNEQNAFNIIFGIFVLLTCRDIFFGHSGHEKDSNLDRPVLSMHRHGHGASESGAIPPLVGISTVKIQYCQSCGYRQAFDEISKMLQQRFPDIEVKGEVHQPNWFRLQIVNFLFIMRIVILAMIYMEFNPFTYFQRDTPSFWTYMSQNKISTSLMIIFVSNSIESNMMSTGAFEIFYNDIPVWSKILTQRMPTGPELLQMIQSQRSFAQPRTTRDLNIGEL